MLYSQLEIDVFNRLRAEITKKADVILTYEMPVSLRDNWADILIYNKTKRKSARLQKVRV